MFDNSRKTRRLLVLLGAYAVAGTMLGACDAATSAQPTEKPQPAPTKSLQVKQPDFTTTQQRLFHIPEIAKLTVFDAASASSLAAAAVRVRRFCNYVDIKYGRLGWDKSPCHDLPWTFDRLSERGEPLVYWEYVSESPSGQPVQDDETTLILGGVHPDEITPIHLVFEFSKALRAEPELYAGRRIVIAPLVNPDGFFTRPLKRTNASGVDLNRNFPTRDWWAAAHKQWKVKRKGDKRHYPGLAPQTEEGTRFQMDLIERYNPDKIISVHAPLGFLDYDGPGDLKIPTELSEHEKRARELANNMSKNSNNYSIRDFNFYPGSLGNYSGNERSIPTVTLELTSTDSKSVWKYWKEFYPGLRAAVQYQFRKNSLAKAEDLANTER